MPSTKHKLPLFSYHRPCLTPTTLFIDLVLAHFSPLDIVWLSHHLLDASLSLYPSPRASFASNTHMHVYRSISQHIPRSTLTTPHRSTYLTSYVSPFSDKGRLIFLCSYVCLPLPYLSPLIIRACLLTRLSHARAQTTSSHLLSYWYCGRALRLSSKPIPPFVRSNSTTTPSNTLALSLSQPYSSLAHMHGCRSISLNTWGRSISLIHEVGLSPPPHIYQPLYLYS